MIVGSMTVTSMIQGVAQPVLVEVTDDKIRQKNVFRKMLRFGAFVSFPAMLGIAFIAKEFILITVGEKWIDSVPYLQILSIAASFVFITNLYCSLLLSHGKSNIILYASSIFYGINLLLAFCLVSYGIFPMVIGCSCFNVLLNFCWHFCGKSLIGIRTIELLKDISPYLLLTIFCFMTSWGITMWISNLYILFLSKILIVALLYSFILWKMKSVIFNEVFSFLFKMKKKMMNT